MVTKARADMGIVTVEVANMVHVRRIIVCIESIDVRVVLVIKKCSKYFTF